MYILHKIYIFFDKLFSVIFVVNGSSLFYVYETL